MILQKNYKPRLILIFGCFLCLNFLVIIRLFLLQVYRQDFFKTLAQQQYITEVHTQPVRALIYDRNGVPLVLNKERLSAFILPHQLKEPEKINKILKRYFCSVHKKIGEEKKKHFLWLERHLSDDRLAWLKHFESPDIYFLAEPERFYSFPSVAHVVGFTDIDNIGIAGIELQCNKQVQGTPTTFVLEKDARFGRFYFKKEIKKQGIQGNPITLTIDNALQFIAYDELEKTVCEHEAKGGAVLIMEPEHGEILAMASYPGFDPNQKGMVALEQTKNVAVTECFELGSVIKVFTTLAALEEGVVTPEEEIDCEGKVGYIDGFRVENWKSLGSGLHPFKEAIARSTNVGIAKIAKRLGPNLYYHLRRLGFGRPTGISFPGERSGFVNPPNRWSRSSLVVLSFGYELMATLLQLGKAFCVIANGGYNVQPTLLLEKKQKFPVVPYSSLYRPETIEQIKDIFALEGWMKDRYNLNGFRIMGKTGTARSVKDKKYSRKDHVYTYGGIIEKDGYKRVVITFVKEPKESYIWASQLTLPLFHRIAQRMVVRDSLVG